MSIGLQLIVGMIAVVSVVYWLVLPAMQNLRNIAEILNNLQ